VTLQFANGNWRQRKKYFIAHANTFGVFPNPTITAFNTRPFIPFLDATPFFKEIRD